MAFSRGKDDEKFVCEGISDEEVDLAVELGFGCLGQVCFGLDLDEVCLFFDVEVGRVLVGGMADVKFW